MVYDPDPVTLDGWIGLWSMTLVLTLTLVFGLDKWSVTCDPNMDG